MLRFAILGLGLGGIYAISTLGLVLVYRGSGVLNFAQGAIAGVGAFTFWQLHDQNGLGTIPSAAIAIAFCALVGAAMHFGVMRPLALASPLTRVIATLGVMAFLQALGYIVFGSTVRLVKPFLSTDPVSVLGQNIALDRLVLILIACAVTAILWAIYRFTRFGLATAAVAENEQTAQLGGHSPNRIALANWMAGCALAGLAGVLVVPISGLGVGSLTLLIVPMLAVGLVSGFSSFPLTLAAAMVIGIIQSEMTFYVEASGWSQSVPFLVVIAILVIQGRPLPVRSHINERLPDIGSGGIRPRIAVAVVLIAVAAIVFLPLGWSSAITTTLLLATVGVSVMIVTGYAGQLSLAQFAFAGFGGLVATRLSAVYGMPFLLAAIIGTAAAVVLGVLIGLPALRTRGINLAIITFGLAFALQSIVFDTGTFTGGLEGTIVDAPSIFGFSLDFAVYPERYQFAALVVLILALFVASNVRRGRAGRRMIAVRSNERAAAALGLSVARAKIFAFAVAAGVAGLAGVFIAFQNTYVQYSSFNIFGSISIVLGSVLGGVGYLAGALVGGLGATGGVVSKIVGELTGNADVDITQWVALGLAVLLIATLIFNPDGVASYFAKHNRFSLARTKHRREAAAAQSVGAPEAAGADRQEKPGAPTPTRSREIAPREKVTPRELVVEGLTVRFGAVVAVDDVSLRVGPGTVVGLMGPNGAGKTTLIDAVTGFVSTSSGSILVSDISIDGRSAASRARMGMSRTFQSLELFEEISVLDNIRVAIESSHTGVYLRDLVWPKGAELTPASEAAIDILGLSDDLDRRPGELPLGRRRLVAIARAIASEPSILLLDEPAAGLDEKESEELGRLIRALANEWGLAILLVEHDVPLLMSTCDSLVAIDHGRYVTSGTPEAVRHDPQVVASYLGGSSAGHGTDTVETTS